MKVQLLFASLMTTAAVALGQTPPAPAPTTGQPEKQQPAAQPAPSPAPVAQPAPGEPTLIRHDANGKIIRPDVTPDEAALDLIALDPGEKEAADQLINARRAILDHVIAENLHLQVKFLGIDSNDTPKEQMQALKDLITKTNNPLRELGSLRDHIVPLLAPQKAAQYNQILSNYWAALTQENQTLTARGKPMTPEQIRGRETMLTQGGEIRRSYERLVEAKADQAAEMVARVKPSSEQDAKIKTLIADYTEKAQGKPTASQKRDLFRNVLKELNYDQRLALLADLYGASKPDARKPDEKAPENKPDEKK